MCEAGWAMWYDDRRGGIRERAKASHVSNSAFKNEMSLLN
jgi:hypothetical protein